MIGNIRGKKTILTLIPILLFLGTNSTFADQTKFAPKTGEITTLGPKSIEFEIPADVKENSIKVTVLASNHQEIPINRTEIQENLYKVFTPMLPPGRVTWSWEYEQNGELKKQNSWFVVDVDWQASGQFTKEETKKQGILSKSQIPNKNYAIALVALLVAITTAILIRKKAIKSNKSLKGVMVLLLVSSLSISTLSPNDTAYANEKTPNQKVDIMSPIDCKENSPSMGLAKCLRLWSLHAANIDPDSAIQTLLQYGAKYRDDRESMCEILEEYLFSAISLVNGNDKAFSLVGQKACGYEGPDIRGIYINSASFIQDMDFEKAILDLTKQCLSSTQDNSNVASTSRCSYPIPWITVRQTNADLPAALKLCREQEVFTPHTRCEFWSIGVFIRLISAYTYNGGTEIEKRFTPKINEANKMSFCQELEEKVRGLCFAQASNSTNHTLQALLDYQLDTCTKVNKESVNDCYSGVGYHLGNFTEFKYKDTTTVCAAQPMAQRRGCYLWSIAGRTTHHGAAEAELIQDVPIEYRKNIEIDIEQIKKNI